MPSCTVILFYLLTQSRTMDKKKHHHKMAGMKREADDEKFTLYTHGGHGRRRTMQRRGRKNLPAEQLTRHGHWRAAGTTKPIRTARHSGDDHSIIYTLSTHIHCVIIPVVFTINAKLFSMVHKGRNPAKCNDHSPFTMKHHRNLLSAHD